MTNSDHLRLPVLPSVFMFFECKGGCNSDDAEDKILSLDWEYAELNLTDEEDVEFRLDELAYAVQDAYRKYRAATRTILFVKYLNR